MSYMVLELVNPNYRCIVKITPNINPIYVGIERFFPDDSKNVSFVDMGLVYRLI